MSNKMNGNSQLNLIEKLDNSKKNRIIFLSTLVLSALIIRLYVFPFDVPFFNDSAGYFWYAIDLSILNNFPTNHNLTNNGWPIFLAGIFQLINSDNFLDYQNTQRMLGVIFSIATIFPVYLLCSRFFKKSYSLLGATLFAFEPRIIQNSSIGTPESLYIFLIALFLALFFSNNFKKIYLAFFIVGILSLVRYEGLLMIIPLSITFFIRFRIKKDQIMRYAICVMMVVIVVIPMGLIKNETMGQDGFVSHIAAGPEFYQTSIEENSSSVSNFIQNGILNMGKYLGWIQIPFFIAFIPLGVLLFLKNIDYKKITIILTVVMILIPAFYAYSRDFSETKYLFPLFPIFALIGCFALKKFFDISNKKELIITIILLGIILSSVFFVYSKLIDHEYYRETYQILSEIGQREIVINGDFKKYGGEFVYFHWVRLNNIDEFPVLKESVPELSISTPVQPARIEKESNYAEIDRDYPVWKNKKDINNFAEYLVVLKQQNVTHLLIDEENNISLINEYLRSDLRKIFQNEDEYPYLIKEYDSREEGYKYHLKLFRIDYEAFKKIEN